jgi:antitoxin (DNA-binding transcriptional repressor) of toxin-antitoxin stability system
MRTVNIAVLKNQLSKYLTYAKAGETITIRDRNTAVAQIIPFPTMTASPTKSASWSPTASSICPRNPGIQQRSSPWP